MIELFQLEAMTVTGPTILDIGCKFGIHPSNVPLLEFADHHLIDADADEIKYLSEHYQKFTNIKCSCLAITSKEEARSDSHIKLNILNHPGGNTFLEPDLEHYYWKELRVGSGRIKTSCDVVTSTLDRYCHEANISPRYLKIDVEGYESNVLAGAQKILEDHVIGIRIEVEFNSLYKGKQSSFTAVDNTLKHYGFEFFNFDFLGNSSVPFSDYFSSDRYGQLVGCDAIYMKPLGRVLGEPLDVMLDYAIFAINNNIEDLAIRVLLELTNEYPLTKQALADGAQSNSSARIEYLRKRCAALFFGLRDKPRYGLESFTPLWERIFDEPWIAHGDYYRKYPLS